MRYDLVVLGDSPAARREAVGAARRNQLVAVIRMSPLLEQVFDEPLDRWTLSPRMGWPGVQEQFRQLKTSLRQLFARHGIDEFQGQVFLESPQDLRITVRGGESIRVQADSVILGAGRRIHIPHWLRAEVPGVVSLHDVSGLASIPESVLIEGSSLPALRLAVLLARLKRRVIVFEHDAYRCGEFDGERKELLDEAAQRGVRIVFADEFHVEIDPVRETVVCRTLTGEAVETGLYVYADNARGDAGRLGLEQLGILVDERGGVWSNACGDASQPHFRAVGESCSPVTTASGSRIDRKHLQRLLQNQRESIGTASAGSRDSRDSR